VLEATFHVSCLREYGHAEVFVAGSLCQLALALKVIQTGDAKSQNSAVAAKQHAKKVCTVHTNSQ
jgi:hypothetical protein